MNILFLAKADHQGAADAAEILTSKFDVKAQFGKWDDKLNDEVFAWQGDFIISYLTFL